jgi:hypothetical protein
MKPAGHGGPAYGVQLASPFSQAYGEQKPSMQDDQGYGMEPPSPVGYKESYGSHTYDGEAFSQDSKEETNYGGEQANYGGEQANYGGEHANYSGEQANYGGEQANYGGEQANYGGEQANYGEGTTYGGGLPVHADDSAYQGEQASDTKNIPKFSFLKNTYIMGE